MKYSSLLRTILAASLLVCGTGVFAQTSPLNIGTLPAGKSMVIVYDVVVNSGTSVTNQAGISGGNFTTFSNNDPKTVAAGDATVTQVTTGPLPAMLTSVKAYQQNSNIAVEWKVVSELGIKQYDVEKSVDARRFVIAPSTAARGNNNLSFNYSWVDVNPTPGSHYYLIRSIGGNGEIKYSQVIKVVTGKGKPDFAVYPNPIGSNLINLQFINQPKGTYNINLLGTLGQVLLKKQISHQAGSSTEPIELPAMLPKGNFVLQVTAPDETVRSIKIIY